MINPSSDKPLVVTFEVEESRSSSLVASTGNGVSESSTNLGAGGAKKTSAYEQSNLTRGQLQIWMGQNLLPEVPIYNLAAGLNIRGVIDPVHFGKAFRTLVNSSDSFRTILDEVDGIPMQRVMPNLPYELSVIDFSSMADPQQTAKSWMQTRCRFHFNGRSACSTPL